MTRRSEPTGIAVLRGNLAPEGCDPNTHAKGNVVQIRSPRKTVPTVKRSVWMQF